jgi:anti-sigma regulatory factor (Ser/Thr protein kinase)
MEQLTVPGTLESLEIIREYVKTAAAIAGLDRKATYRLVVAVDEVASNIVTHGYAEVGLAGMVNVWAEINEPVLTIYVEDTGEAYDPSSRPADDFDLLLEEREIGGLGLFLANRNVDEFRYKRFGDRNRHTFVVYRNTG